MTVKGYRSVLGSDENVLTSVFSEGYTTLNILKNIESCV